MGMLKTVQSTRHPRCRSPFTSEVALQSLLITANQPFGEWHRVFPDETTAVAAVDRLVHHATILEMNVESYRRRAALDRGKRKRGRPANFATEKNTAKN